MNNNDSSLRLGSLLMTLAGISFIGYGLLFLYRNFYGTGFELGVDTINGVTRADLDALNTAIVPYIGHLHVATSGFIASAGLATAGLSWYGVRQGALWAWIFAVLTPVVGLVAALPMHYMNLFAHDWVTHLGPIYLATTVFVIGALMSLKGVLR